MDNENLKKLGFKPTRTIAETLEIMLKDLSKHRDRILEKSEAILPKTLWSGDLLGGYQAEPTSSIPSIQTETRAAAL